MVSDEIPGQLPLFELPEPPAITFEDIQAAYRKITEAGPGSYSPPVVPPSVRTMINMRHQGRVIE